MLRFDPPHDSTTTSFYTPIAKRRADLTVHFDEILSPDERVAVEKSLTCRHGIEKISFQSNHPHLAIVYYDVFLTSTDTIVKILNSNCLLPFQMNNGEASRVHVQIVGL
jgi:hypothetical protein